MIVSRRNLDGKRGDYDKVTPLNINNLETDNSKPVERRGRKAMDLKLHRKWVRYDSQVAEVDTTLACFRAWSLDWARFVYGKTREEREKNGLRTREEREKTLARIAHLSHRRPPDRDHAITTKS